MAAQTMGERMAKVETWQDDHERRCDDRQAALGREIRDMKHLIAGLTKGAWGVALGIAAWLAMQLYTQMVDQPPRTVAAAETVAPR